MELYDLKYNVQSQDECKCLLETELAAQVMTKNWNINWKIIDEPLLFAIRIVERESS